MMKTACASICMNIECEYNVCHFKTMILNDKIPTFMHLRETEQCKGFQMPNEDPSFIKEMQE